MSLPRFGFDDLLRAGLYGLLRDLPDLLGSAITVLSPDRHRSAVLAAQGIGLTMDHYQLYRRAGPAYESARRERPVLSNNVWHDLRWPRLDVGRACELYPGCSRQLHDVYGVATLPIARNDAGPVLLSAYLKGPPAPSGLGSRSNRPRESSWVGVAPTARPPRRS